MLSRITIVTSGTPMILEQIKAQLDRLVPIHSVSDLTMEGEYVERDLALIKVVKGKGQKRVEALRIADIFRARVVDSGHKHFVFEIWGQSGKLERLHRADAPLGARRRLAHRHRRHCARAERTLETGRHTNTVRANSSHQGQIITLKEVEGAPPCAFITTGMPT